MHLRVLRLVPMVAAVVVAVLVPATGAVANPAHPGVDAFVVNGNSSLCLAFASGSGERPVIQASCSAPLNLVWTVSPMPQEGFYSRYAHISIETTNGYLCLAARGTGETQAIATTCDDMPGVMQNWLDQQWTVYSIGGGVFQFKNEASHLCLAARGMTSSPAIATTCDFDVDQHWADQYWRVS